MPLKVLFIEDEPNLLHSVTYILELEGFTVQAVERGLPGVDAALANPPDLVLLDLNLPDIDGFEVCRRLKANPKTRDAMIFMLSARGSMQDVVDGLSSYADDYLTKPFQPRILMARIHALARRRGLGRPQAERTQHGVVVIDSASRTVEVGGAAVNLTKTEFDILLLLSNNYNRVLTREQILDAIRGTDYAITERIVDYQVSGLRRKLGEAADYLDTIRGVGYRFLVPGASGSDRP